jgi:hypothetical protein
MGEMHANLMCASGFEMDTHEGMRTEALFHPIVSDGFAPIASHCHLQPVRTVSSDGLVYRTAGRHAPNAHSQVFAPHLMLGKRSRQRRMRLECARND